MGRIMLADSSLYGVETDRKMNYRGINVFTLSELQGITGKTRTGQVVTGELQMPFFNLRPEERMGIMQSCAYVQAVISSRMNRISTLEWNVVRKDQIEDEYYYKIKHLKEIFDEHGDPNSINHALLRFRILKLLKQEIPELLDDLSNMDSALRRWKKRIKLNDSKSISEIEDWLFEPNMEDEFDDFIKKWVEAYLLHGAGVIYKEHNQDNKLENLYVLPGGTTLPFRGKYVGSYVAYVQVIFGYEPKIYFKDEVSFANYLPSAARSYGYVPLDALINKVAEQLLFDQFAAERADGTKAPEKLLVFGDTGTPFGNDLTEDIQLPLDKAEQKRIEEKVTTARKEAIAVLSGVGHPVIHDISKADTFAAQAQRQDKLLRDTALVFNMTNMEINLAGGEFTSGKETSESQREIEEGKGTRPIVNKISSIINRNILPFRFGSTNKVFQYKKAMTEFDQIKLDQMKQGSGSFSVNEIREERGDDPYPESEYDRPQVPGQTSPDGSELNPLNVQEVR